MKRDPQGGTTLIELVVAITIIAMASATIVGLLAFMSRNSAEGMSAAQRASFANAYLTRTLGENFDDVDSHVTAAGSPISDGLNIELPDLEGWEVRVEVSDTLLNGDATAKHIRVTVTDPFGEWTVLSGIKTQHP
jgi:type II secretory pathway pseudopilin PulG